MSGMNIARKTSTPALPDERKGPRGRQPEKRLRIVAYVRNNVARGRFPPGSRLPDRSWFMRRFGVTRATAQTAFDQLSREGFTVAVRRKGTSVAQSPPFRDRCLLVLSGTADAPSDNLFGLALADSAHQLARERAIRFEVANLLDESIDSERYETALADIRRQRYAGVFLRALSSSRGLHTIGNVDHVPISGFFSRDPRAAGSMVHPLVENESQAVVAGFSPLLAECARAGKRRVFVISNAVDPDLEEDIRNLVGRRGLECPPDGYHTSGSQAGDLRQLARLFRAVLHPRNSCLPDAVVLNDDNFLAPLELAIRSLFGSAAPPFFIVSEGNRPRLPKTTLNVRFHGIDTYATLSGFLDWVNAVHAGDHDPPSPKIVLF